MAITRAQLSQVARAKEGPQPESPKAQNYYNMSYNPPVKPHLAWYGARFAGCVWPVSTHRGMSNARSTIQQPARCITQKSEN